MEGGDCKYNFKFSKQINNMNDLNFKFPLDDFEELIKNITGNELDEWVKFWEKDEDIFLMISKFYGVNFRKDWLWGVVLPILSHLYQYKKLSSNRLVLGLSALPGTGKTTLGILIEKLTLKMNIKVLVVSMDDFYLPSEEMKIAIKNNPWSVSRGFPGSHSISLIENRISQWKNTGIFNYPVFDKSLRSGLGDRSSWRTAFPEIIIFEGWFLGVNPIIDNNIHDKVHPSLLPEEITYRSLIQSNLKKYLNIWKLIDKIWQIIPNEFQYMNEWKSSQEKSMLKDKGNALVDKDLSNFLRMLNCSIPKASFSQIESNYKIILDKNREVIKVGLNKI